MLVKESASDPTGIDECRRIYETKMIMGKMVFCLSTHTTTVGTFNYFGAPKLFRGYVFWATRGVASRSEEHFLFEGKHTQHRISLYSYENRPVSKATQRNRVTRLKIGGNCK